VAAKARDWQLLCQWLIDFDDTVEELWDISAKERLHCWDRRNNNSSTQLYGAG
jgi:hypothetical protein